MLQDILGLVTKIASGEVANNDNVSDDHKAAISEIAFNAIAGGLSGDAVAGNISGVGNILQGVSEKSGSNALDGILQTVGNSITEKLGIDPSVANNLASSIVPKVMEAISGKVNDPNDKTCNVASVLGMFMKHDDKSQSGGLMNMIGGFLGAK